MLKLHLVYLNIPNLPSIISVSAADNHKVKVVFDDGLIKEINVLPFIKQGVSSLLKDENYFKQVKTENGYIT